MGWEDGYDEFDWEEDEEANLEEALSEMSNSIIHVDEKLIYRQAGIILKTFYDKFGYSLRPEIESKTFIVSLERGYVAGHFVPVKFNSRQKYYTLIFNPQYKNILGGYQYSLDFTNGFYDSEGGESDAEHIELLMLSNNIKCVEDALINHWIVEEMIS